MEQRILSGLALVTLTSVSMVERVVGTRCCMQASCLPTTKNINFRQCKGIKQSMTEIRYLFVSLRLWRPKECNDDNNTDETRILSHM